MHSKPAPEIRRLPRGETPDLAYETISGAEPGVIFFGGFTSDMTGTKASALLQYCREQGVAFTRFDYRGHGGSEGAFSEGTISFWLDDALAVIDHCTRGPLVLVGSSMGAWIMALAGQRRPQRVAAMVGIAAAPDFCRELIWPALGREARQALNEKGVVHLPSRYDDGTVSLTAEFFADGERCCVLGQTLPTPWPVRLLHGLADEEVPWQTSVRLAQCMEGDDIAVTLVKHGDHRFSNAENLALLYRTLEEVRGRHLLTRA